MRLTGLHLLWTHQCTFECDHCFAWGSPWQTGTMTLSALSRILDAADDLGTIEWIYFEGGEAFLYYQTMRKAVETCASRGFRVGVATNAYWATDEDDALECLKPFKGLVEDLSISSDLFHSDEEDSRQAQVARKAAEALGIPVRTITIVHPGSADARCVTGQIPPGKSGVMYRGRAVEKLAPQAEKHAWQLFVECPYEDLREPGRVHVDPLGNLHICQGLVIGNLLRTSLREVCEKYDPEGHAVVGALLEGGPAALVRRYDVPHNESYADACHLCYESRRALRARFPEILTPDQMYGEIGGASGVAG
jgi:MoaA/NifB/PqqE/SkfB family radical SAM enzyme